nr:PHP domain-containing protein [Tissierella sp.]
MLIDTHLHEDKYSFDSKQSLEDVIGAAKSKGLDGICVTNHDNSDLAKELGWFSIIDGLKIIVGSEVYTKEGDILYFGRMEIPNRRIPFKELLEMTQGTDRAFIAAHPYRCNNRGMKDHMRDFAADLTAIEGFNGNTSIEENMIAVGEAINLGIPISGGGDSHWTGRVGKYATKFDKAIESYDSFIKELNAGRFTAAKYLEGRYVQALDINYCQEKKIG